MEKRFEKWVALADNICEYEWDNLEEITPRKQRLVDNLMVMALDMMDASRFDA